MEPLMVPVSVGKTYRWDVSVFVLGKINVSTKLILLITVKGRIQLVTRRAN
jgi:hypothetical protein